MIHTSCHQCSGPFLTEWEGIMCDSCELPTHREVCGDYRVFQTPHDVLAHFMCLSCLTIED